jgi:hypothetical protein
MKKKQRPIYDDQTLENMKRYFKIESHDALLSYIKKYGLAVGNKDDEYYYNSDITTHYKDSNI